MKPGFATFTCTLTAVFASAFATAADEWFVDLTRPDDTGDGMTQETAFRTIKTAVARASAGDTITVLPGVYADEWAIDSFGYTNRVYLNKAVHLRSRDGAAKTVIAGRHDPSTDVGSAAVRCVLGSSGAIVEGFTLADGAGHTTGGDLHHSWAGGAAKNSTGKDFYLVDCVVTNCTGHRGGAVRYATAVRCRFSGNYSGSGNLARDIVAVNCLIVGNGANNASGFITDSGTADFYNCTIMGNVSQYAHANARLFNSVEMPVLGKDKGYLSHSSGAITVTNSVLSYGKLNTKYMTSDEVSVFNPAGPQFIASALADFRVAKGADAEGLGDASHLAALSLPDSIDPFIDLAGRKIPETGPIQAGCFQEVVEPAGGAVVFEKSGTLNGKAITCPSSSAYPTSYPVQWNYKPDISAGRALYAFVHNDLIHFPLMDDSLTFMPPSDASTVITNTAKITSNVYYVDPAGSDDNDGLSPASPFKTLQKAVDSAYVSSTENFDSTMTVVMAAAGEYDDGHVYSGGHSNIIAVTDKRIRFKGAGSDVTTIRGRHDPDSPAGDGRGPFAVRCAHMVGYPCAIQGFTMADGACSYEGDGTGSDTSQFGGAVYGTPYILDCVISNCAAYRGAAVYGPDGSSRGKLHRTRITGCKAGNGLLMNTDCYGCVVYGNDGVIRDENRLRHCTVLAYEGSRGAFASGTMATNCIAREYRNNGLGDASANNTGGNVLHGFYGIYGTYADKSNSIADPQLVSEENADLRVKSTSPALATGVYDEGYWKTYTTGVDGNPILFFDGKPLAGAVQSVLQVIGSPAGDHCTIEPAGDIVLEAGESVSWSASGFTRPPLGFATNGVPVGADTATYTYDGVPQAGTLDTGITYLFGTNWYVNARTGSDDNTGFTADTPKKTLAAAMETKLYDGDVVHLAAGVYSNGLMGTGSTYVSNRVVVTKAIALVGDADASEVIIEGAESPEPTHTAHERNLGPGSVRCGYFINSGATVRNITFRNGHTYYQPSSAASFDCHGGGVAASEDVSFHDCAFISNAACRAGGAWGGTFYRCRFDGNLSIAKGAHIMQYDKGSGAHCYNCLFETSIGPPTQDVGNIVGCLFENEAYHLSGSLNNYGIVPSTGKVFANNIVLCGLFMPASEFHPSNCVYVSTANSGGAEYFHPENCIRTNAAAVAEELDAVSRKILSRTSWLVDAGATGLASLGGDTDFAGSQRVYNAAVDIGPFEYDWRERYSSDIGKPATVTYASPAVRESEGRVTIPDGASLAVTIEGRSVKGVDLLVPNGVLEATGGRRDETFTDDAMYRISTPADVTLAYSGEDAAVIDSLVWLPGSLLIIR